MSLTVVSFGAAVRIGGEHDADGARGFVLLACEPTPCLLTRRAARDVARALARFAERVRPVTGQGVVEPKERKERTMDETRRKTHDPGRKAHHA
jgi:hypothetical protein